MTVVKFFKFSRRVLEVSSSKSLLASHWAVTNLQITTLRNSRSASMLVILANLSLLNLFFSWIPQMRNPKETFGVGYHLAGLFFR